MRRLVLTFGLLAALAGAAVADVNLVTIPTREGTQLTIYNSEDITMVREHRLLTVKDGINRIQFSWANYEGLDCAANGGRGRAEREMK